MARKKKLSKREELVEFSGEEELLFADGFDDAIIGVSVSGDCVVAYDFDKCVEILAKEMSYEEAVEYMDFNVVGSYMGEQTPVFIRLKANS